MKVNWDRAINSVLVWEGGFAERANEPGGAVNKGVSLAAWREEHPDASIADLKAITDDQAKDFYKRKYWNSLDLDNCPPGLDVSLLHAAIMQGVGGAKSLFRASLGLPLGTQSLSTLYPAVTSPLEAACGLIIQQMRAKMHDKNVGQFGPGWSDRFVAVWEIARELAGKPAFSRKVGV